MTFPGKRVGKARGLIPLKAGKRNTNAPAPSNIKGTVRLSNPVRGRAGGGSLSNNSGSMTASGRFTARGNSVQGRTS